MESFARAGLLLLAAVLLITYANHGPAGVHAWFRAKLLGRS